ncbi:uncharacterized protein EI97DRAFT_207839 [Westerdykella ornata]|uniref:C2H2-type domain-containing protein n=1 Tax=Westerdykella ornata TaxID=318751 RepID=A0A6A6J947_WESOR|nr:uncharacterized protein EI97DRAFT_207839 [Westerdykella ornata]KAF2272508.1 hypothetical protein EI97DRAFT_207839 [Westerdykella ornata]
MVTSAVSVQTAKPEPSQTTPPSFPPPKTDKPRPHICLTCTRSFARLEHLKRHERSHTKEKPFECQQCTRAFARRDLLLRHQQKLHQQGATSSKPRLGRRESTTGLPSATGRVRKNSIASSVTGAAGPESGMRPRANTISHIDPAALNSLLASQNVQMARSPGPRQPGHSHHPSLGSIGLTDGLDFRTMQGPMGMNGLPHTVPLPKLDTHLGMGMGGGPRTAPITGLGMDHQDPHEMELQKFFGPGSTINPNQLHHFNVQIPPPSPFNLFHNPFSNTPLEEDIAWTPAFESDMVFPGANETAFDGSSPSAISTASQSGFSEVMLDGSGQPTSAAVWQTGLAAHPTLDHSSISLEAMAPVFPELMMNQVSPKEIADQGAPADFYLSTPPPASSTSPAAGMQSFQTQCNPFQNWAFQSDSGSISSTSINGSARHSSVTSISTDTITDATRQALLMNLSQAQNSGPMQRKFSQPHISSPLSGSANGKSQIASLPSTSDLQRYVNAYIQYFHPHLPFLHIPTLSFDPAAFNYHMRGAGNHHHNSLVSGGGCLILAMAAIGAQYEFEHIAGKELFESAKKMILYSLEERRLAGLSAVNGSNSADDSINKPPLWLIQAMLLNLIFGHNCGDKQAAEAASTHCAALVSLAKAADLDKPAEMPVNDAPGRTKGSGMSGDVEMIDGTMPSDLFSKATSTEPMDEHAQWLQWKMAEERKRTYFAIFSMTCLLVSAYAHAPRILNSEIRLDLPCEEDLWAVDNAQAWVAKGGPLIAQSKGLSFNAALSYLIQASLRQQAQVRAPYPQGFGPGANPGDSPQSEIRPSTFGCYVLINALHVYIWDTRQRHNGRPWKPQETEQLHALIEPALKAWQAAWRSNPSHSLERPSPYGPLAADCIPLLDLAYVRLFVNLAPSKELFWQRDFEGMANELAKGVDIVGQTDGSPDRFSEFADRLRSALGDSSGTPLVFNSIEGVSPGQAGSGFQPLQLSKRERHLRKAAFYAADSLAMGDKLGATYVELSARELPNSSAMCSFDCAQILAEWVATVQDRVGRFIGILGKDDIDLTAVPAIMLLEEEDIRLLSKISNILHNAEMKLAYDMQTMGSSNALPMLGGLTNLSQCGYGTKLLMVTAYMLERSAVWPVTHTMALALEAHAHHINQRAEASVNAS